MVQKLPNGKINNQLLAKLLKQIPKNKNVLIPPKIGVDAAGIYTHKSLLCITTDPITFTTQHIGKFCVEININDLICMGARPQWLTINILLPPNSSEDKLIFIWEELITYCEKYQITIIGGHTEVTDAVKQPLLSGTMFGEPLGDKFLDPAQILPGDSIYLINPLAIEGTAISALEKESMLSTFFSKNELATMQNLIFEPGICILPYVNKILPNPNVIAIHDITEGGLLTALHEMADSAGIGVKIYEDKIPILPFTKKLSQIFSIDPLGLLGSGSFLLALRGNLLNPFSQLPQVNYSKIGEFVKDPFKRTIYCQNTEKPFPRYDKDEILKILNI